MGTTLVEEGEVAREPDTDIGHCVVGVQIDLLVLDGAPKLFDEDALPPAALAVHADLDLSVAQHGEEVDARELRAMVGIEYLGRPKTVAPVLESARQKSLMST